LRIGDLFEPSSQMDKANCEDSVCRVYNPEKCWEWKAFKLKKPK